MTHTDLYTQQGSVRVLAQSQTQRGMEMEQEIAHGVILSHLTLFLQLPETELLFTYCNVVFS